MSNTEQIREVMRELGSRTSDRKSASSAANLDKGRAQRELKPCTCGQSPHTWKCPVYARQQQAKRRSKQG